MLLTETCLVVLNRAVTYIDVLSITAALLIVLFITFISIRQHRKSKNNKNRS